MKRISFIILSLFFVLQLNARHIAGGELYYKVLNKTATGTVYEVTLRLFRDCQSLGPALASETVIVGIYENNVRINTLTLGLNGGVQTLTKNLAAIPCLVGNVNVCYEVAYFTGTIELVNNANGYTLTRTGCCRVDNISNVSGNGSGSTFMTTIPGNITLPIGSNTSAIFNLKDTSLVCARKKFVLDFGANDADGDTLSYGFCNAYTGLGGTSSTPPTILTLNVLNFSAGYSGSSPLGATVSIDYNTGQITGIAPPQGQYVVSVCVNEIRNREVISYHVKDFILKVQDCDIADAELPEIKVNCKDYKMYFENENPSSAIISYAWDFGDPLQSNDTSTSPTYSYTYTDTGTFKAFLRIKGPNGCLGEDSMDVKVYPGFSPNFSVVGSCYQNPFAFTDLSTVRYGVVNKWFWKFGDLANTSTDTSTLKNPSYLYPSPMNPFVNFIVNSSKGCADTLRRQITVTDKPFINIGFRDTLICSIDTLLLNASSPGYAINWVPNYNITSTNSPNPFVYPKDTTTYYITASSGSCTNTDSIKVNVLDFIDVQAMVDTSICTTDTIQLKVTSKALNYQWSPNVFLDNSTVKNPFAFPNIETKYFVEANLGKCQDKDSIIVSPFPYPKAEAGNDTTVCIGKRVQLNGSIVGDQFNWSPTNTLLNPTSLSPVSGTTRTTNYILTSFNTIGCLKKVIDTIQVVVVKAPAIFAGNDTSIVLNQSLFLKPAIIDTSLIFSWSPTIALSNPNILNPIVLFSDANFRDSIIYTVKATTKEGCVSQDDIKVKVFKTGPDILIPDAFSPNKDGRNDVLKPIPIGISMIDFFSVYNRWGQLLFTTKEIGKGWDGTLNGLPQPNGTYIFQTQGMDYTGKIIFKKGVAVLIR